MAKFAKIFDIPPDNQVLVMLGIDPTNKQFFISERTVIDHILAEIVHEFDTQENCQKQYDDYDLPRAQAFFFQMYVTINDATGKSRINGTGFTKN